MGTSDSNDKRKRERGYNSRGRFEQWARNPNCEANVLSAVLGASMDKVAKAMRLPVTKGQSPFAISRGHIFERNLFKENAKIAMKEFEEVGLIAPGSRFVDLRQKPEGGPCKHIDEAMTRTEALLKEVAATKPSTASVVVAGPVVKIPGSEILLPEALLIIDVLVLTPREGKWTCTIGEVKTYTDREGYTDSGDLGSARAQAGMYVHALQCVVDALKLGAFLAVMDRGFLILAKAGSLFPSIRRDEDLRYMAQRAKAGFERLRKTADHHASAFKPEADEHIGVVKQAKKTYKDDCLSFCDLALDCRAKAEAAGLSVVLGSQMDQFTGGMTLHAALELVDETRKPANQAEEEFLNRVRLAGGAGKGGRR